MHKGPICYRGARLAPVTWHCSKFELYHVRSGPATTVCRESDINPWPEVMTIANELQPSSQILCTISLVFLRLSLRTDRSLGLRVRSNMSNWIPFHFLGVSPASFIGHTFSPVSGVVCL